MAFNGTGSNVTSLNAANIASGTVPTARLASGTANSTTFLRGDSTWATAGGGSDVTIVSSSSLFTSSGTYTVPTLAANEQLYALMISGGGSGGAAYNGVSGGFTVATGGGCRIGMALLNKAQLAATISYTVGGGGAAVSIFASGSTVQGNAGGSTSVTSNSNLLTILPGGDAGSGSFAEGNFTVQAGSTVGELGVGIADNNPYFIVLNSPYQQITSGRTGTTTTTTFNVPRFFGGGSVGIANGPGRTQNAGGAAATTFTGAGGSGSVGGGAGAGSAPGGGGGGSTSSGGAATSGAGASGAIRFYVVQGIYDAQSVFNKVFTL